MILSGLLKEGERLESSRRMADQFELSRGSVNQAYDMLFAEGYVRAVKGSGTYVSYRQPDFDLKLPEISASLRLSSWANRLPAIPECKKHFDKARVAIDFNAGAIDKQSFPIEKWKTAMFGQIREEFEKRVESEATIEGYLPLREAIIHELRRERGIIASADDIFITSGSTYAIALLAMLFIEPGDSVVLENPSFRGLVRAVRSAGGEVISGEVDDYGLIPDNWKARLLFVTPTRQFPTGVQLAPERRIQLLEWASRQGAIIVEDDYDSEFRLSGRPAEPLKAIDHEGRVVYVGSFSKTMFSDLRLGYAIVPAPIREPFRRAMYLLEPYPSGIARQRAMAEFIANGEYKRHVRRQKRLYGRRLLTFREEAGRLLEQLFRFSPSDSDLHQYAQWRGHEADYERFRKLCLNAGVSWSSGDHYWLEGEGDDNNTKNSNISNSNSNNRCSNIPNYRKPTAMFGFAHLSEEEIIKGIQCMEHCWKSMYEER